MPRTPPPPPFCPYPDCTNHEHPTEDFFQRHGTFRATARNRRPTQRYRCKACRRTFSDQTLRFDFRILQPALERRILQKLSRDDRSLVAPGGLRVKVARLAQRLLEGPVSRRVPNRRWQTG